MYAVTTVPNPLDHFDAFLKHAISLTYMHINHTHRPPTLDGLSDHLPDHFRQELGTHVVVTEDYGLVGAEGKEDLIENLRQGVYDRFIPDTNTLRAYLNDMSIAYLERCGERYELRNGSVVEVW